MATERQPITAKEYARRAAEHLQGTEAGHRARQACGVVYLYRCRDAEGRDGARTSSEPAHGLPAIVCEWDQRRPVVDANPAYFVEKITVPA